MRFRVLGPLSVVADGREVPIGGNKLRVVLAGLLLRAGETVPVSRLAGWLWPDDGGGDPDRARATVHSYVNRLRGRLGPGGAVVVTAHDGYRAEPGAGALDLLRFRELAAAGGRAAASGDLEAASRALSEAMALWRGGPLLANVDSPALHAEEVEPLAEEWLRAQERWLDVGLRTGRHAELIGVLRELTRAHPLREPLWERLMLALHGAGRHAEALRAYHTLRELLAEELGVDPGEAVRATYQAILTEDPSVREPAAPPPPVVAAAPDAGSRPGPPVPRQLRPDIPGFAGRAAELATLDRLLDEHTGRGGAGLPTIVSLQGTAGSGKTALAVHWAHRVRERFPGGQLYLDLHGYGPERPVGPAAALETLLRALGAPPDRIPAGLEERAALYRTLLSGRRVLVLLDNAAGSDQVRPLVPGSDGMVLVTSRNQLRGLVVQYGARRIVLDQMSPAEAGELLAGVIGPERVAAEPEAAAEIVERCARLPLALRIFAERAARFPRTPLRRLAADLRDERTRLAALDAGDGDDTDLRMVFSWTYGALEPEAARLFRLLGLHPGPEVSTGAAGALLGEPDAGRVTRLLDRLTADHLLRSRSPGRYDFHDLLRAYAAERARAEGDAERDGEAALRRVLDWYLHSALDAAEHLPSGGRPFAAGPVPDGLAPHDLHDAEGAVCWYEEELANLMAATHAAAARGWHDLAWRLPRALARFFDFHVPGRAWVQVYQVAVNAARAAGEPLEEGVALNHLARALALLGRPREAARRFEDALAVARRAGERDLEGAVLVNLGTAYARLGRSADSTGCFAAALALARETGDRRLEAEALDDMAQNHNALGRYEDAASAARSAAEAATAAGDRYRRGEALRTLGTAYAGLGRHEEAVTAFLAALEVKRAFEDRRGEADVLHRLGRALVESGDPDGARSRWRESLAIFAELDDPRAADVRRSLAETGPRPAADPRQETPVT